LLLSKHATKDILLVQMQQGQTHASGPKLTDSTKPLSFMLFVFSSLVTLSICSRSHILLLSHLARQSLGATLLAALTVPAAVCADLSINGVNQDILGLQSFSHGLTNALEGGQALLNVIKMEVLLLLGHLPVLQASTDYMHQVYFQRRKSSMSHRLQSFEVVGPG